MKFGHTANIEDPEDFYDGSNHYYGGFPDSH